MNEVELLKQKQKALNKYLDMLFEGTHNTTYIVKKVELYANAIAHDAKFADAQIKGHDITNSNVTELEIGRFNNTFMNLTTSNLDVIKKVIEILEGDTKKKWSNCKELEVANFLQEKFNLEISLVGQENNIRTNPDGWAIERTIQILLQMVGDTNE